MSASLDPVRAADAVTGPVGAASPEAADFVTVLRIKDPERYTAAKQILRDPTDPRGWRATDIRHGWQFEANLPRVRDLDDFAKLCEKLAGYSNCFVIRGAPKRVVDLKNVNARKHDDPEKGPASFAERPRRWVLFDFDDVPCPVALDPASDPDDAAMMLRDLLPDEFQDVACFWMATGKSGFDPDHLRFRLGFWLGRPLGEQELKGWLAGVPCDHAVFQTVQPIYTAAPDIDPALNDPMGGRRFGRLSGTADTVPVPDVLPTRESALGSVDGAGELGRGVGFEGFLAMMGDGEGLWGFHGPLVWAVASYAGTFGADRTAADAGAVKDRLRAAMSAAPMKPGRRKDIERYGDDRRFLDPLLGWVVARQRERDAAARQERDRNFPEALPDDDGGEGPPEPTDAKDDAGPKPAGASAAAHASIRNGGKWRDGRTNIILNDLEKVERIKLAASLLSDIVYMRGGVPTVLKPAEEIITEGGDAHSVQMDGVRVPRRALVFSRADAGLVKYEADKRALFWKDDGRSRKLVPRACPPDFAAGILDGAHDSGWRFCAGISRVPLIRPDGSITAVPGFDPASELILDLGALALDVPDRPTRREAEKALSRLLRPFRGYDGAVSTPLLATAALTALARPSMALAPAIFLDGNSPGVGKGKLARALAVLGTGLPPAAITEGSGGDELEKRLATAIISGVPVLTLDNLTRDLASSTLESLLTEEFVLIRILGTTEQVKTRCRALVTITANNLTVRSDLLRRVLPVRIEVPNEHPERRRFDFDVVDEALRERPALLSAGFTILRAWLQAKAAGEAGEAGGKALGSFEEWAGLVAGAVEWLTGENPVDTVWRRLDEDPAKLAERRAVKALHELSGGEWFRLSAIIEGAGSRDLFGEEADAGAEVLAVLREVTNAKGKEGVSSKSLGHWLRKRLGKVIGGLTIQQRRDTERDMQLWRVEPAS